MSSGAARDNREIISPYVWNALRKANMEGSKTSQQAWKILLDALEKYFKSSKMSLMVAEAEEFLDHCQNCVQRYDFH